MAPGSAFAVLAAWLLVACTEPGQYGGPVPIDQVGLGPRLRLVCRASILDQADPRCSDDPRPDASPSSSDLR